MAPTNTISEMVSFIVLGEGDSEDNLSNIVKYCLVIVYDEADQSALIKTVAKHYH